FLDLRAELQETSMVLFGAKTHHVFDAGAVVPAAVKDHDLARCWKLLNVTLHEHLRFFPIRRRRKRHHSKHAWAHAFGDGLDGSPLAGGVASFEHDDDSGSSGLNPILQMTKLDLKLAQLLLVSFAFHFGGVARRSVRRHSVHHFLGIVEWSDAISQVASSGRRSFSR